MCEGADGLLDQEAVLHKVMKRQAALSLRIASIFVLLLIGLPLLNLYLPNVAQGKVGGFTFTWLFLGVLFFPITWILSAVFVRESDQIEDQLTREIGRHGPERHEGLHPLEEVLEDEDDDLTIPPPPGDHPHPQPPPPRPSRESVSDDESTPRDQGAGAE